MKRWLFIASCLAGVSLNAQNQINPVIQVERLYDADLIEVTKPLLDTQIPDSLRTFNTSFQYGIFDKPLVNLYEFIPLPPATVRSSGVVAKRYGTIDLGLGYPWTPRGDILLQAPIGTGWHAGLQARHRSLLSGEKRMRTDGMFTLEHRGKQNTFRISALGEHLKNDYAVADVLSATGLAYQNYYNAGVAIETYALNGAAGSWHYHWKSGYNHAKNNITGAHDSLSLIRENILDIDAVAGYNLTEKFSINLGAATRFASDRWTSDGVSSSRAVVSIFPHVILAGERYKVGAGLRAGYLLGPDGNRFGIFPWFNAHLTIAQDWLSIYAGMQGYHGLNTYQDRMTENPWVFANQMYDATVPWDVQAGFTGSLGDRFHYKLFGAYRYTKNQFFYGTQVFQQGYPGLYTLSYSDETRYTAGGSLAFRSEPFEASITGQWHKYSLSSGNPPWHRPSWEIRAFARYNWRERIIVSASGYWRASCFAPDWIAGNPAISLPGFFDLGARIEYLVNRLFGAYVFGNNLLNRTISYFYLYPNPGLTLGGGISLHF
ncbi:MAG: hypothetical protein WC361_06160 [Bacteroidales bacterium]|jgi:hypothetical protein